MSTSLRYNELGEEEKMAADRIAVLFNDSDRVGEAMEQYLISFGGRIKQTTLALGYSITKNKRLVDQAESGVYSEMCYRLMRSRRVEGRSHYGDGAHLFGNTVRFLIYIWKEEMRGLAKYNSTFSSLDEDRETIQETQDTLEIIDPQVISHNCYTALMEALRDVSPKRKRVWLLHRVGRNTMKELAELTQKSTRTMIRWCQDVDDLLIKQRKKGLLEDCEELLR